MSLKALIALAKELEDDTTTSIRFKRGDAVFIRCITMHHTGRIEEIDDHFLYLSDAAWIASSGVFSEALKTGKLEEVEPFPDGVAVSRAAIVDMCLWSHALPRERC